MLIHRDEFILFIKLVDFPVLHPGYGCLSCRAGFWPIVPSVLHDVNELSWGPIIEPLHSVRLFLFAKYAVFRENIVLLWPY